MSEWLTPSTVVLDAEMMVAKLKARVASRAESASGAVYQLGSITGMVHPDAVARAATEAQLSAGLAIREHWFHASVGINETGERETLYLTRAPLRNLDSGFQELDVYHWSGWLGALVDRIRDRLLTRR